MRKLICKLLEVKWCLYELTRVSIKARSYSKRGKWCFLLFFLFLGIIYLLLFKYRCLHLTPSNYPKPHTSPILPPLGLVHVSFKHVPWWPFPFFPLLSPSPLPSGYCQIILYFSVSGYILLSYLFSWLGSTYRWGHMELFFHCLAYFT